MNRRVVMSAAVAGLAAVALLAWFRSAGQADRAGSTEVVTVARRSFAATVSAIGVVEPQIGAEVRVGSLISGRVRRLRANIGDAVAKGQIIAELETEVLDALIAQRSAELKVAEAQRAEIETLAPDELAQAEAQLARYEATAKLASGQWERQQALFHRQMATQAEVDAAQEQTAVAQAQLESARRSLELVRAGNEERMKQAVAA
ncbi:MAG: hypothetical protein HY701_05040, partial [Gemmatimonadetes bacterium]|nr:hypothetical protein [Gemmatimonadota bacterium]